jgi:hypothetical protein
MLEGSAMGTEIHSDSQNLNQGVVMPRIIVVCLTAFLLLAACGKAEARSMNGTWRSSGDIHFVAHIKDNQIEMYLVTPDIQGLYWKGTWPKSRKTLFVSKADRPVLAASAFGSENATKNFQYRNGALGFFFTMQGESKYILLRRV